MSRDNWFAQVVTICWQATTFSILSALLNKNDQFSSMIYHKNYTRVPSESEGTLNKGRVRGQNDSLGNTWN